MEIRLLRPEEYDLLGDMPNRDKLMPDNSAVAAILDEGKVKGHLVLISLPHIEAAWIEPGYRNGFALYQMEELLIKRLKELGSNLALAFAVDEQMESYIKRLGYQQFATAWKKEI